MEIVKTKLLIGLTFTSVGYSLTKLGITEQYQRLMPRKMIFRYNGQMLFGEFLGLTIGSVWATVFFLQYESTLLVFAPFIAIALIFFIMLMTCIWSRLKQHQYFTLKQQEKLLKKSLLNKNFSKQRASGDMIGQKASIPSYFESLDSGELITNLPVCVSDNEMVKQEHASMLSQNQHQTLRSQGP